MSFTFTMRQGPARMLAQRLPELTSKTSSIRAAVSPLRSIHTSSPLKQSSGFFTSRITSATASRAAFRSSNVGVGARRAYNQSSYPAGAAAGGSNTRRLLVGGAIFGGTLVAINLVFNRETREDGGMPVFEREYLNNTFLHTGLGIGIIGLTARQMVMTGFTYRLMVMNPWVVGIGGLALSFATMIGTRSISPDNYIPKYAQQDEWEDKELQKFAIEFYRISDKPEENQRWVDSFCEDARVQIGADKARGTNDLAQFRTRMWKLVKERKHTVLKVFPGRFPDSEPSESEVMILGEVGVTTTDGRLKQAAWSAHAVVKKVDGAWKFKEYRVWLQDEGLL